MSSATRTRGAYAGAEPQSILADLTRDGGMNFRPYSAQPLTNNWFWWRVVVHGERPHYVPHHTQKLRSEAFFALVAGAGCEPAQAYADGARKTAVSAWATRHTTPRARSTPTTLEQSWWIQCASQAGSARSVCSCRKTRAHPTSSPRGRSPSTTACTGSRISTSAAARLRSRRTTGRCET